MSLLPLVLNELLDDCRRPVTLGDLYDQHFGLGLGDLSIPTARAALSVPGLRAGYLRPWRSMAAGESGVSTLNSNDNEFSVKLDVTHFKPEELTVKIDDKGFVVVEGKHEEKQDHHGFISRHFQRRYKLPENVLVDTLASNLSSDGVLSLTAALKPVESKSGREIKIEFTNRPALKNDKGAEEGGQKKGVKGGA